MAKPWSEVAQDPAFQALPQPEQEAARQQYFTDVVAPQVPEHFQKEARFQFDRDTSKRIDAPKPGLMDQAISGAVKGSQFGPFGAMVGAGAFLPHAIDDAAYAAGGKVTDVASRMGLPEKAAAGLGFAANVGLQAIPAVAGGGVSKAVAPAMESAGTRLMQSALKPTIQSLRTGDAARAISTMLEQGYNATKGGVAAMKEKIAELEGQVTSALANYPNATVSKNAVASRLNDTLKRFEMQVNPRTDTASLTNAWTEFLNHPLLAGKSDIPVQLAQDLKQGTYKQLGSKAYGEVKSADVEAQKALARGLKEEISAAVPEIAPITAKQSELINAKKVAERRALMDSNKNPIPLPASIAMAAHDPLSTLGLFANSSALAKSILARLLYSGSERIPQVMGGAATAVGQNSSALDALLGRKE